MGINLLLLGIYLNGEIHKKVRLIMGKAFQEIDFQKYMEEAVDKTNQHFGKLTTFNLSDYCGFYIYHIIKRAFDFQKMGQEEMTTYSNAMAMSQDVFVPKQVYHKINDQMRWAGQHFEQSRFKTELMRLFSENSMNVDDASIYSIMSISTMAAFETSKDNLTMALLGLLRTPQLIEFAMEATGSSLELLMEELFRFSSPLQFTIRVNKEALELDGNRIPANSKLYLSVASANRDEEFFLQANEIVPNRTPNDHLAFGGGVHFCLGASVARAELRSCLKPMLSLLKNFQLDNHSLSWNKQIFMRSLKTAIVHKLN
jgi:cytochrome P450